MTIRSSVHDPHGRNGDAEVLEALGLPALTLALAFLVVQPVGSFFETQWRGVQAENKALVLDLR
jgi:hypothetical protein